MRDRLDFSDMPTSLAGRLTPSARVADALLHQTLGDGGCDRLLGGEASLAVIHGIKPIDGPVLCDAVSDLVGCTGKSVVQINASGRDWTDPSNQRTGYVERLLVDVSVSTRPMVVLCHRRTEVPGVVATVADAVLRVAGRREAIAAVVRDLAGFHPDDRLVSWLERLPISYLNLAIRPGTTADRMWRIAGRLRRHPPEDGRRRGPAKLAVSNAEKPATLSIGASKNVVPERLEDLPGMGEAQRWGLALAADLVEYRAGSLPWSDIENGMLLHGPPGTGKTLFAKALAGSCGVPLHSHSVAAWQSRGHLGDLLKAMRAAFAEAGKTAPCVLFVDELDSVGSRDEPLGDHASYQRQVVNGLLECLDGAAQRDGVVVIGATNKPAVIDPAVLRPGRLGRHIEIRLPDIGGRVGILKHHLRGELPKADLTMLADEVGEVSGAALAQLVREARAAARRERRPLSEADLWAAVPRGVHLSTEAFRRLCLHEAGHVVVGMELATLAGIVPVGATVRRRMRHGNEHRTEFRIVEGFDATRESFEANVVVLLAGLAAEETILGSRGVGSGGTADADLVRATQLVAQSEFAMGFGERLHSVPTATATEAASRAGGDPIVGERIELVLSRCLREAKLIIERRRDEVERFASMLSETARVTLT
ncbi:AAA family ATPase [Aureimonas sp. ME7]|uniref:AAA family ATPase n=1 Tax=Aureimonas sp. ME7 TaxID=2744252 RepID=UPI0015F7513D|nr:AAA family ATPase [Aureimonas sp. ME7]